MTNIERGKVIAANYLDDTDLAERITASLDEKDAECAEVRARLKDETTFLARRLKAAHADD